MSTSGPENRFLQSVHRLLPASIYRMKNHNPYVGGVPDCWYSGGSSCLWVEYKFLVIPKRPATIVDFCAEKNPLLSVLQQEWIRSRHIEGRNVGVIIGSISGGLWLPGVSWQTPLPTGEISKRLITKKAVAELITELVT